MTPPRVDAHLHLPASGAAGEDLLGNAQSACEIGLLAVNSTCEQEWANIVSCSQRHPKIKPFLGIHPWWANTAKAGWQQRLVTALTSTRAGVGEIGLDALAVSSPAIQEALFIPQLEMAQQLSRPVTIHCCRRWGRLIDLLSVTCKGDSPLIIHGFSGSLEIMHRLLDLGAMLSFGPSLGNPSRIKTRQAFQSAPLDRVLLESDWPPRLSVSRSQSAPATGTSSPETILANLYSVAAGLRTISLQQLQTMVWNNGQIFTH